MDLADFVAAVGTFVLAFMGLLTTLVPRLGSGRPRLLFVCLFLVIGAATVGATLKQATSNAKYQETISDLQNQVIGSRSYLRVVGLISQPGTDIRLPVSVLNNEGLPALDVSLIIIRNPTKQSLDVAEFNAQNPFLHPAIQIGTVLPNTHFLVPNVSFEIGKYEIFIRTKGGQFRERLEIVIDNDGASLRQSYVIRREDDGRVIASSE